MDGWCVLIVHFCCVNQQQMKTLFLKPLLITAAKLLAHVALVFQLIGHLVK